MDVGSMQQATQAAVKKKFGRKRLLPSKVVTHYPENLEREYVRLTNSYMSLFSNTLKTYLPKIRATLEDYERGGFIVDAADDKSESDTPPVTHSVAVMAATNIKLERLFAE
ncbi:hypothetical protein FACS18949_14440 [Clostridia bacterium]|nr:hypothetical protein FACS189425_10860 [Clostridia bacterium]GHV35788.1 hypothetical protein FACS18949_14440 [Clostridia bacterium]